MEMLPVFADQSVRDPISDVLPVSLLQSADFYGTCKAIDMLRRLTEVKAEAQDSQLAAHATRT